MRVVTLLPSATEIVASLGAGSQIVGISHECDYPPSVTDRPRLTASTLPDDLGTRAIDARVVHAMVRGEPLYVVDGEQLESLEPDLVVTQGVCTVCAVTPTQIGLLDGITAATVLSLEARDFAGVLTDIEAVGQAMDLASAANELVAQLRQRWNALSAPNPDGPRVLFAEWPDPLWIGGHWVPELVEQAGGVDPYGTKGEPSYRSTWSEALERDPDVVVFGACGYDLVANQESARGIDTARARRYAIDANRLASRPGPRLVEGLEVLKAVVAGDLSDTDPSAVAALAPVS